MSLPQKSHSLYKTLNNESHKQQPPEIDDQDSYAYALQICNITVLPMAMQAVVDLGVFDIIHRAGPDARLSAAEIATELSCKNPQAPSTLDRFLRILADHSVLHCSVVTDENQNMGCSRRLYGLTPVAKFFVSDIHGASLGPYLKLNQHDYLLNSWTHLKDSILEGGTAFKRFKGFDFYDYTTQDLSFSAVFQEAMENYTIILMKKILECYKGFEDVTSLVDVGGGLGISLNLITSKYPHIHGINFDLPEVINTAPIYPRVEHVGGDMFESVPKGDTIFMRWIFQDWDDEHCLKLLKNCYNAIPKHGKLIVVHAVLDTEPDDAPTTKVNNQFEIILRSYDGGRERTKEEFMNLVTSAGFSGIRFVCLVYCVWVMEIFK